MGFLIVEMLFRALRSHWDYSWGLKRLNKTFVWRFWASGARPQGSGLRSLEVGGMGEAANLREFVVTTVILAPGAYWVGSNSTILAQNRCKTGHAEPEKAGRVHGKILPVWADRVG